MFAGAAGAGEPLFAVEVTTIQGKKRLLSGSALRCAARHCLARHCLAGHLGRGTAFIVLARAAGLRLRLLSKQCNWPPLHLQGGGSQRRRRRRVAGGVAGAGPVRRRSVLLPALA